MKTRASNDDCGYLAVFFSLFHDYAIGLADFGEVAAIYKSDVFGRGFDELRQNGGLGDPGHSTEVEFGGHSDD